jgi:peptide/nickel transport system substrate-binding protein
VGLHAGCLSRISIDTRSVAAAAYAADVFDQCDLGDHSGGRYFDYRGEGCEYAVAHSGLLGSAAAVADLAPYYWAFDSTLHPAPYDPGRAKALLDSAGWRPGPDGVRVRNGKRLSLLLVYGLGSQTVHAITAQVQQMYRELGIEVELKGFDYATLYAAAQSGGILNGGKFDLAVYAWVSGSDPDDSSQWSCAMIPPAGNNVTRYCSPEMEAAQRLALSTFDQATRKRAYAQIERLLLRDAPAAFIYYQNLRYAHADRLSSFTPNGISEGWNAQEWRL